MNITANRTLGNKNIDQAGCSFHVKAITVNIRFCHRVILRLGLKNVCQDGLVDFEWK